MSIQALVGLPGHGKSYSAIELFILTAAAAGRPICTNIPLTEKFREDYPVIDLLSIDLDAAKTDSSILHGIPGGSLVLLDELWRIWPAGLKPNDIPVQQMAFIKEHRHKLSADGREMDIVLVTQDLADIASSIRQMTETTIICNKLTDLGQKNRFRRDYYRGAVKGFKGSKALFIKSDHGCKYQESVYQYYKSHTQSTAADGTTVDNSGVVNATIFNSFGFKFGLAALFLLIIASVWGFRSTANSLADQTKSKAPAEAVPAMQKLAAVSSASPAPPPALKPPQESSRWRLVGRFVVGLSIKFYLISDGNSSRRISPTDCKPGLTDVCMVDGDIVASYTGRNRSDASVIANYGVSQLDHIN